MKRVFFVESDNNKLIRYVRLILRNDDCMLYLAPTTSSINLNRIVYKKICLLIQCVDPLLNRVYRSIKNDLMSDETIQLNPIAICLNRSWNWIPCYWCCTNNWMNKSIELMLSEWKLGLLFIYQASDHQINSILHDKPLMGK